MPLLGKSSRQEKEWVTSGYCHRFERGPLDPELQEAASRLEEWKEIHVAALDYIVLVTRASSTLAY
eukprot:5747590-Amphidinium_carterae.1